VKFGKEPVFFNKEKRVGGWRKEKRRMLASLLGQETRKNPSCWTWKERCAGEGARKEGGPLTEGEKKGKRMALENSGQGEGRQKSQTFAFSRRKRKGGRRPALFHAGEERKGKVLLRRNRKKGKADGSVVVAQKM